MLFRSITYSRFSKCHVYDFSLEIPLSGPRARGSQPSKLALDGMLTLITHIFCDLNCQSNLWKNHSVETGTIPIYTLTDEANTLHSRVS